MAEQKGDEGTPRRYEETMEPQNPPNSVLSKDARRATVLSYFVPVVLLFVVVGIALVYWSNQPEHSQSQDRDRTEIGTAGRTDGGGPPEERPGSARDEIQYRGGDLAPITRVEQLKDVDARVMNGRRVSIDEAEIDAVSGNMLWVRDGDETFAVIAPTEASALRPGTKVSITGHLVPDTKGAPQIRAERVQAKG
jgi:hypothetical protein